jgi:hypothetical protein
MADGVELESEGRKGGIDDCLIRALVEVSGNLGRLYLSGSYDRN